MWIPSLNLGSGLSSLYAQVDSNVWVLGPDCISFHLHIRR